MPEHAVAFVADQLDVDPGRLEEYRTRAQTAYEHAWQIRDTFGYREFSAGEGDLRAYLAARVWASEEGPKALFDRAVLYLLEHQILLPGLTVLSRPVSQVRKAENARLHQVVARRIPHPVRAEPGALLQVPGQARFSELERLRAEPDRVSSPGLVQALDRTSRICGIGAGKVQVDDVPQIKLEALARSGIRAKAPALADLVQDRREATLLATVRHLKTASVDDALDVLITSKPLNRAVREGNEDKLRALPDLKSTDVDTDLGATQRGHWQSTYERHSHMYGADPSEPARRALEVFTVRGARTVLELGSGHGRDALWLASRGLRVHAADFGATALEQLARAAREQAVADRVETHLHDARTPLPLADASVDGVFAHMLLCMALTTTQIHALADEIGRVGRDQVHQRAGRHLLHAVAQLQQQARAGAVAAVDHHRVR